MNMGWNNLQAACESVICSGLVHEDTLRATSTEKGTTGPAEVFAIY